MYSQIHNRMALGTPLKGGIIEVNVVWIFDPLQSKYLSFAFLSIQLDVLLSEPVRNICSLLELVHGAIVVIVLSDEGVEQMGVQNASLGSTCFYWSQVKCFIVDFHSEYLLGIMQGRNFKVLCKKGTNKLIFS